jgi:phosphomevalonate kinase
MLVVLTTALSPATSKNKFVHLALQKTLSLALEARGPAAVAQALGTGLDITIVADNDFYSQQDQVRIYPPIPNTSPIHPAFYRFLQIAF